MDELPGVGMGRLSDREGSAGTAGGAAGNSDRRGRPAGGPARPRRQPAQQPEPGTSLDEAVRANGPLSLDEVQSLGATLASLLTRLHAAGEVHGDLRPATVFLTSKGARLGEGDPFRQAAIVGDSVYFVAPELLDDPGAASAATDVFALGSVLAFAATGVSPFGARSVTQPADGSAAPDLTAVPEALRRIVERCLDGNSAVRPTAITLSILFAARLEDVPVAVVPVPTMLAAERADVAVEADADADADEADATLLLQRPLFFFVRRRAAALVGALALVAVAVGAASLGIGGSHKASHSATSNHIANRSGATTPDATLVSSSSSSTVPPSSPSSSSPSSMTKSPPAPARTTTKPPAPRVAQPPAVADMGRERSAPAAPSSARIVSGYVMTADVSWPSVPGATQYEVSYSGSVSGSGTVTTNGTSTTLKGLFPSEQLCAKVRSVNQYGSSAWVSTSSCIMVI